MLTLKENLTYDQAKIVTESTQDGKNLFMQGIFVQGDKRNQINLDRVSHLIEKMWMDGQDGYGRLKLLPTPMGNICKTLIENGVKLGVSSRGSGNVTESGNVSEFEIQTVDLVANPSAPDAYPDPLYEQIMNGKRGNILLDVATAVNNDSIANQYLQKEVLQFIEKLDIRRS